MLTVNLSEVKSASGLLLLDALHAGPDQIPDFEGRLLLFESSFPVALFHYDFLVVFRGRIVEFLGLNALVDCLREHRHRVDLSLIRLL